MSCGSWRGRTARIKSAVRNSYIFLAMKISITDLEVHYHVGVPDEERARPQRLLLTVEMEFDFSAAAKSDSIADTIDYFAVSQRLLKFGNGKNWKLIEKLTTDIGQMILREFRPQS